jgi:hypothetical protein
MLKLYPITIHKLAIVDLAGLSNETIIAGNAAGEALGTLGTTALTALVDADTVFRAKLITSKVSPLTEKIHQIDRQRDASFMETWYTANTASKSSTVANAEAGQTLVTFLKPYRNVPKEPLMSETSTINYLQVQYNADTTLQNAATVLQLTNVFSNLFNTNKQVSDLWNERAREDAEKSGPSPSSLKNNLEKCYNNFCVVTTQSVNLQPSAALENLFSVMNEIRIKYAKSLPIKLTDANTSVAPIEKQKYTGKLITPVPQVFFKTVEGEVTELRFTIDFYVTYKNNIEAGEAKIIIHGKGKYAGSYTSTFYIEN